MSGHKVSLLLLNKDGMNELMNKCRKTVKKWLLEWIENVVYSNKLHSIIRVYKTDHNTSMKFKSNSYKKYSKKPETGAEKYEAIEDAGFNYSGLDDYLTKDKKYNQVFKKYYDDTCYENVDDIKELKEYLLYKP